MKFVLFIKDNTAIAKARKKSLDNIDISVYDKYEEITETEFNSIELPAEKIDDVWSKTEKYPTISYPESAPVESEPTAEDMLNALVGGMSYEQ